MLKSKFIIFFLCVLLFFNPFTPKTISQSSSDTLYTKPSLFYLVGKDIDIPPINPIAIKEDNFGNIHTWFFYLEPGSNEFQDQFISIYYSIAFNNGSNYLKRIGRERIVDTKFEFFQKLDFVETQQNELFNIYLQTSDFGINLIQLKWSQKNQIQIIKLQYPVDISFTGRIIGPITTGNVTDYYLPGFNNSLGSKQIFRIRFEEGKYISLKGLKYPEIEVTPTDIRVLPDVFDIVIKNGTRHYLGGFKQNEVTHSPILLRETANNSFELIKIDISLNVAPVVPNLRFFSAIRVDILRPQLVKTENGRLFSFLFSLDSENEIRQLVEWTNNTRLNVFRDEPQNPFLLSFLPTIKAVKNEVRIASLGIQYAQDIFSVSIDLYKFSTTSNQLTKQKFLDDTFSSSFFLFALDLTSDENIGFAATMSIPNFLKTDYGILNNTVGSLVIFADHEIPEIDPNLINVVVKGEKTQVNVEEKRINYLLYLSIILAVSLSAYFFIQRRYYSLPSSLDDQRKTQKAKLQNNFLDKLNGYFTLQYIYLKTNKRRILLSTLVLIIPTLILMSLLVGVISHKEFLIHTYENQNPINNSVDLTFQNGDFIWTRGFYDDEFTNRTITKTEWQIPEQLSKLFLERIGVIETIEALSTTTVFPLFEKRNVTIINEDNENETLYYPVPHEFAIIDDEWLDFMASRLISGRLPTQPNEVLLQQQWYVQRDIFNENSKSGVLWDQSTSLKLYGSELDIFLNSSVSGLYQNVKVVGIVSKVENLPASELTNWTEKLNTTVASIRNLDRFPFYMLPELSDSMLNKFSRLSIRPQTRIDIRYNVFDIDRGEIPQIIDNYNALLNQTLQETGIPWVGNFTDTRIIKFLEGYFHESRNIQLEGSILVVPVFGLSLLIMVEGLGLSRTTIEEELVRLRNQGFRIETIFSMLFFENLLSSFVATTIAILFVPITTEYLLQLTGFFKIGAAFTPNVVMNNLLMISGVIFGLNVIIGTILSLAYVLNTQDWRYQKYLGSWKKDIIIIFSAVIILLISGAMSNFLGDQIQTDPTEKSLDESLETLILAFRIISLLIGVFGAILIASKTINYLFYLVGRIIWSISKTKWGLFFNGISSNMGLYGKILVIMSISLFLIVPMVAVPQALNLHYQQTAYNEFGTDIKVSDWHLLDDDIKDSISNMEHIDSTSSYFFGILEFANGLFIRVLAIDPSTFLNSTVLIEKFRNQYNINESILQNLNQFEIITNRDFIDRNPINIGDNITVGYPHLTKGTNLTIRDTYLQFPVLKNELMAITATDLTPLQMVITIPTLQFFQSMYRINSTDVTLQLAELLDQRNAIIKIDSMEYVEAVANQIKKETGLQQQTVIHYINEQRPPFYRTFEFISHISILVGLIVPILSVIITASIIFERRKFELEVYRRNGLTRRFFIFQISFEVIIASFIPSLIGLILGSYWSVYYGAELFGEDPASLTWRNDNTPIWLYTCFIMVASLLLWIQRINQSSVRHIKEVRL